MIYLNRCKPFFALLFISFFACQNNQDTSQLKKEILIRHEQERKFHFEKKASEFANSLSENIIMVNRGKVSQPTRAANEERFRNYFNSVEFVEWDDNAEPIIEISEDGKMAYVVVQKTVSAKYEEEPGDTIQGTTKFAWVSIYEKENGEWKIVCNASTNQPETIRSPSTSDELNEEGMEVLKALEKFSQAYRTADTETLSNMLTDKYIHSNSGGSIIRKESWLKWVGSRKNLLDEGSLSISEYFNEDVVIETYGNAATVHGINISSGVENGKPFAKKIAFTHTWIKENGEWKRASFHDSKIN